MASILMISGDEYPTYDTMLETVFTSILPEHGYEITWLMPSRTVTSRSVVAWNEAEVFLFPIPSNSQGLRATIRESICWLKLLIFATKLIRHKRFDIIQTRGKVMAQVFAWAVSKFTRMNCVYQFGFPEPEMILVEVSEGRRKMPWLNKQRARIGIFLRDWINRHSDLVLAISDEMRRQLIERGVRPEQVIAFPMGTDCPPDPDAVLVAQLRQKFKLDNVGVVIYFGVLSRRRNLDFLIRVASIVNRERPLTRWLFVGYENGTESSRLMQLARDEGLADVVTFTGPVPRSEVPAYISLANLSVSPIPTTPVFWLSSPSKAIDALANGCPVVGTDIPDQAIIFSASGGGMTAPFEEQAFASAIDRLLGDPDLASSMGKRGKAYVRQYRSYQYLTKRLDQHYLRLLEKKGPSA